MKRVLIIYVIFSLVGCASTSQNSWYNPIKEPQEARKDIAECKYEADKYSPPAGNSSLISGYFAYERQNRLFEQCLSLRGFSVYPNEKIAEMEEERAKKTAK